MSHSSLRQIFIGLWAPIWSFRFLWKHKRLFLIGILPHIVNFIAYFWFIGNVFIGKILPSLEKSLNQSESHPVLTWMLQSQFVTILIWIMALLLYGVLGAAFVNAIASPIYDFVTQKAFEETADQKLHSQSLMDFVDSMISEFTKAVIVICVFIISFFIPFSAPVLFLLSIWYLGWNTIDRTLLLMNLSLRERAVFGVENFALCMGLGIWSYIPGLSALIAFSLAPAGGIVMAKMGGLKYFEPDSPGSDF